MSEGSVVLNTEHPFGGCPQCGGQDRIINLVETTWFVCDTHKTKWSIARSSIFPFDDSYEELQENCKALESFNEVDPLPLTSTKACPLSAYHRIDLRANGTLSFARPIGDSDFSEIAEPNDAAVRLLVNFHAERDDIFKILIQLVANFPNFPSNGGELSSLANTKYAGIINWDKYREMFYPGVWGFRKIPPPPMRENPSEIQF